MSRFDSLWLCILIFLAVCLLSAEPSCNTITLLESKPSLSNIDLRPISWILPMLIPLASGNSRGSPYFEEKMQAFAAKTAWNGRKSPHIA